jgi:hypothetical protein
MAPFSHVSTTCFGLVAPSVPSQSLPAPISLARSEVEVTEEIINVPETKTTILEGEFDVMEGKQDSIHFSETETNEAMSFREGSSSNSNRQDRPNTPLDSLNIESAVPPPTPQSSDDALPSINAYGYEPISPQERAYHRASALMALEAPPPPARSLTPPPRSTPSTHRFGPSVHRAGDSTRVRGDFLRHPINFIRQRGGFLKAMGLRH